ncbi:UPF0187 protein alr2987 [Folsomia candida]|uniref:UPF0187 protein alr2987 n=1 Tax=Folsomia candida TaxID=158441 RepID=UPI000B902E31|nr:UPF0187 protein alr2987 [Folsomia candida]
MDEENIPLISSKNGTLPEEPTGESQLSVSKVPLLFRFKGTVIISTWWQILLIVIYSCIVVYVHERVENIRLNFSQALIDILGIVTGLLLAFRTNTAYERYSEGRALWSQMTLNIRNLTRYIWMGVDEDPNAQAKSLIEKKSAVNLLIAFAVATKHYLREEYSYEFGDLKNLISHIHVFNTPSSNVGMAYQEGQGYAGVDFSFVKPKTRKISTVKDPLKARDVVTPTNIPLELSYYIASYINHCRKRGQCDDVTFNLMEESLSSLVECLTSFERILRTPIPLAYSVHLHHMTWLYLVALPYQIMEELGWWTVAVVAIATFSFIGILEIGWEIENPFGYDANDLPLDDFCKVIKREIDRVLLQKPVRTDEWIFSESNRPFAPECMMSAKELLNRPLEYIAFICAQNLQSSQPDNNGLLKVPMPN